MSAISEAYRKKNRRGRPIDMQQSSSIQSKTNNRVMSIAAKVSCSDILGIFVYIYMNKNHNKFEEAQLEYAHILNKQRGLFSNTS